jgi:hypothetical protein
MRCEAARPSCFKAAATGLVGVLPRVRWINRDGEYPRIAVVRGVAEGRISDADANA